MSSDYVSRLRAELLRAGAAQPARRPAVTVRRLRPLAAALAVCLLVAGALLMLPGERDAVPSRDGAALTYRVPAGDAGQAARILRERLAALGVTAEVRAGDGTLTIAAPPDARDDVAALAAPGNLAIYDWEASVLGADGRPAPADFAITGGPDAGHAAALTEAEARSRAAKCPGAVVVHAGSGWFALGAIPALTNADIAQARAGKDPAGGPDVTLSLTSRGQDAFRALTRKLARRGIHQARTSDPLQTSQHFAIVLDGRILATPYVNWREAPDGIDGADGFWIPDLGTAEHASRTAALLSAGPLPELER